MEPGCLQALISGHLHSQYIATFRTGNARKYKPLYYEGTAPLSEPLMNACVHKNGRQNRFKYVFPVCRIQLFYLCLYEVVWREQLQVSLA